MLGFTSGVLEPLAYRLQLMDSLYGSISDHFCYHSQLSNVHIITCRNNDYCCCILQFHPEPCLLGSAVALLSVLHHVSFSATIIMISDGCLKKNNNNNKIKVWENSHRFLKVYKVVLKLHFWSIYLHITAGPNHPPKGLLRLNLRIFYISFHFSTKLSR